MKFSIIIPCYNESSNLDNLIKHILPIAEKNSVEFVLVENGSKDSSRNDFKQKIEGKHDNVRVVYVDNNQGYGYGILQGIKKCSGDYIGWIHADLQVEPVLLEGFFKAILQNESTDLLLKGKRSNRHAIEYFFSYGMGVFESLLFKAKMKEVMAMPVIFSKELIQGYEELIPYDFSIDIFIYALANRKGYRILHLPVRMKDRENGDSSWNTGIWSRIKQSKKMIDASFCVKNLLDKGNK